MRRFLDVAIRAARAAGAIQLAGANGELGIDTKSSAIDLVTHIDRASEKEIRAVIGAEFPDHVIFGEEEGQSQGDAAWRWIVDPLDGTVNYAHRYPFWCVSIALEVEGALVLGVVFDPLRDELFTAVRGEGAWLNGAPIGVTATASLQDALVGTGFAYLPEAMLRNIRILDRVVPAVQGIRRPGAAALDLAYVACGRLDGFWELTLQPWDVAAGTLLIREAGGTVTTPSGRPYAIGDEVIVASNGPLHGVLLEQIGGDRETLAAHAPGAAGRTG